MSQRPYAKRVPPPSKKINWGGCICGTAIIAFIVAVVAIILAVVAINNSSETLTQRTYETSFEIQSSPLQAALGSAGALVMTLPNDLENFVGKRYTINSLNAQMHTVTIDSGSLTTTWDGVNKKATFGGAPGDGVTFMVLQKDLIRVESEKNVAFSP